MGGALLLATLALRLWRANWHVPFIGGIDGPSAVSGVKSVIDNGWYLTNPLVGAPTGQHLQDFAGLQGDNLQWLGIKVLGVVIPDAAVLVNVVYVLGFALVAASAFVALRYFRVNPPVALASSLVYAILPYHFARGVSGHLLLANYMAVPAGCVLVLRVLMGRPFMRRRMNGDGWRAWMTPENIGVALACLLVGLASLYYALFTILLLVLAALVRWAASRSWRSLIPAAIAIAVTGVLLVIDLIPGLAYRWANGPNPATAVRTVAESEVYSLTFTELLMPVQQHVLGPLATLRSRFDANQVVHNEPGWELGMLMGISFVAGLVLLAVWALRPDRRPVGGLVPAAAVGAFLAFMVATFGGISEMIALLVSPQIRTWSRLTPFIAFFALVLVAAGLNYVCRALRARRGGAWTGTALLAVVVVFALADQVSPTFVPAHQADAASWKATDAFVQRIETTAGAGAMVLQLPLHRFPEGGPAGAMNDYDHFAGYLHSDTLRWSFGAVAGRPGDWTTDQADLPIDQLIPASAAAGFAGAWIDLAAYPDRGAALVAQVRSLAGPRAPYFTSPDSRRAFVGFAPLAVRLQAKYPPARLAAAGNALVHPSVATFGAGFYARESDATQVWYWAEEVAMLDITNPGSTTRALRLSATLNASPGADVSVMSGRHALLNVPLPTGTAVLAVRFMVPPGGVSLSFRSTGANLAAPGDGRNLRLQLVDPAVRDPALMLGP